MSWRDTYASTLRQLSVPSLYLEVIRLENSIKHLQRSNTELGQHELEADEDTSWVRPIVSENEEVITKQGCQIELVKLELSNREAASNVIGPEPGGRQEGSNGHQRPNGGSHLERMVEEDKMDVHTTPENGLHL